MNSMSSVRFAIRSIVLVLWEQLKHLNVRKKNTKRFWYIGGITTSSCKLSNTLTIVLCEKDVGFVEIIQIFNWLFFNSKVTTADCLNAHNAKRALHGVPNLQWNATLASESAAWALYLAITWRPSVELEHSVSNGTYGENLYNYGSYPAGSVSTCAAGVTSW
jgi:hypothetical protein